MENVPEAPAEAPQAPESEATPITNSNPAPEAQTPQVNMHGFTEAQLADMERFYAANGGFDAVKSKISNPQPAQQQAQEPQAQQQIQEPQHVDNTPPKGYASVQELSVERFFKDLANDPKYETISDQIANGDVLKEMVSMGMTPIDSNYNINVNQLNKFLELKAASVPAKPTTVEPTTTPTVDYVPMEGDNITSMEQALDITRQSVALKQQGMAPHPGEAKALEFLRNNGFAQ